MPLLRICTSSQPPSHEKEKTLLSSLSSMIARELQKPERYVMTCLVPHLQMTFGGTDEPACHVELTNIGQFTPELTERLSAELGARISAELGVARDRIYIEFKDALPHLWGFDGSTFA